ncbi:MAG TPA: sensor histidine kinase [Thermomicrobiales bacterium]|jgi:signal transduction histidine kinase
MIKSRPIERGRQRMAKDAVGPSSLDARRPGWQIPLPVLSEQLETFQFVEWILIITAFLFHFVDHAADGWTHWLAWTVAIAGFALLERAEPWFMARDRAELYIALRTGFAAWAVYLDRVGFITTFLFFVVVVNAWGIARRLGIIAAVTSAVALYGTMFWYVGLSDLTEYVSLLPWLAGIGFIGGTTQLAKREQEARERSDALLVELRAAHQQLQEYAEQADELATTRERNRLAREIHDSLGHYLTIINVQLETALALRPRDAARADRAVGEAKRLASEALTDVRRSVAALRPSALEKLSIREAITAQIADFRQHSNLAVKLTIEGDEGQCSQAMGLALYRALQEGLTNIRKHAEARNVTIRLRFGHASTELMITDDGCGIAASGAEPRTGGGFGLDGLRERMTLLGGSLEVRSGPEGGTELRAILPCGTAL